jgi:hypothetical protein
MTSQIKESAMKCLLRGGSVCALPPPPRAMPLRLETRTVHAVQAHRQPTDLDLRAGAWRLTCRSREDYAEPSVLTLLAVSAGNFRLMAYSVARQRDLVLLAI